MTNGPEFESLEDRISVATPIIGGLAAAAGITVPAIMCNQAEAAPIVTIVTEKANVPVGTGSYFSVNINPNGERVTGVDIDLWYSNSNLTIGSPEILNAAFWQNRTLYSGSSVDGQTNNIIELVTPYNYNTNSISAAGDAFRVPFTANTVGLVDINSIDPDFDLRTNISTIDSSQGTHTYSTRYEGEYGLPSDNLNGATINVTSSIPEPATWALVGSAALLGAGIYERRRMKTEEKKA